MIVPDQRQRLGRAVLAELVLRDPALGGAKRVMALAPGTGAANHLWRVELPAGKALLKIRADPLASVEREAWALRLLRGDDAPRLLARARAQDLIDRAVQRRDLARARALDVGLGELLLMSWCPGQRIPPAPSDGQVEAAARAIAALHARRVARGPRGLLPSSPRALVALGRALLHRLRAAARLDVSTQARATRAVAVAQRHLERVLRRCDWQRVRRPCHGDLRWHNLLVEDGRAWLVDLEHAGIGDPAVDLALMACRTPLSDHDELRLLDAYLGDSQGPGLLDRYFALKPLLGVIAALAAVQDLGEVLDGAPCAVDDARAWLRDRTPRVRDELDAALARALDRPGPRPRLRLRSPRPTARGCVGPVAIDGTAGSLKSPLAAALARALGWAHVDTGLLYRHAALLGWVQGLSPQNPRDRVRLARALVAAGARAGARGELVVDGQPLDAVLRAAVVERSVARWAACREVRDAVDALWQPWSRRRCAVFEGRDVGHALAPRAALRIFVDGPLDERAARQAQRAAIPLARARSQLARRDHLDRTRALSPLVAPPGALRVRIRDGELDAVVRRLLRRLEHRRC